MRRLLIFTALFPPLALVVFIAPHLPDRDFLEIGLLCYMLGLAYVIVLLPAWLTAGVDWALSARPFYLRVVATMAAATILTELTARYMGEREEILNYALIGAIPAAVCSWLSSEKQNGKPL